MPLLSNLLLLLLSFSTLYSSRALKVNLLDTLNATSELNWRTYSNQDEKDGWLEETMYSKSENRNHQVYSTCNYEPDHDVENWLLIPAIERREAQRLYLDFNFTIVRCATVKELRISSCKETLKLYAVQLEQGEMLSPKNWHNETKWDYVDTLASHSTDTEPLNSDELQQTYTQTSSYNVSKPFVHFALRNTGACSSLVSVKIYYNICPERMLNFLHLPRAVTSREVHGVVSVQGRCSSNASPVTVLSQPNPQHNIRFHHSIPTMSAPTAICKADGTWQVLGSTECACDPGYIPSLRTGLCTACGPGTYKATHGSGECLACPAHSRSNESSSVICQCINGFHRRDKINASSPCENGHLSSIQSSVGIGDDDGTIGEKKDQNRSEFDWLNQLSGQSSAWLWIIVCVVVVLSLCIALILLSRNGTTSRKQMSDLDALDNYKDTISPDYSRSLNGVTGSCAKGIACLSNMGQCNTMNSAIHKKVHTPLIRNGMAGYYQSAVVVAGGTQLRTTVPTNQIQQQNKMYVDPTTYEDPAEILAEFTNEIRSEDVEVTRVIGAGEFGEVCCGRLTVEDTYGQKQQQIIAVKTLLSGSSAKARSDFLMEASIMGQFEHENVIRLIGVVTKTEPIMILTEYMLYGSLDQFLRSNRDGKLSMCQLVKLLHGIASGMKYLTDKAYVHRDLAARNVLVDDRLTCKIADFGLSRGLRQCNGSFEQEYTTQQGGKIPIRWTAPEAIMNHKYTAASDVWSFGIVMWEVMSFGERPYWDWTNHHVIQEVVHNGYRLPAPQDTPKKLYEMMLGCWQADRHLRPTFINLLQHLNTFFNNVDFFYKYI